MSERMCLRESSSISGEHPKPMVESPPVSGQHRPTMSQDSFTSSKMSYPSYNSGYNNYNPQSGTYVVQVPKDQIYRVPPPENAHKYKTYTQRKAHRSCCRSCCCCLCITILILVVIIVITAGVLYLVLSPKTPSYSVESVHIKGINMTSIATTSGGSTISPVFNITVKTHNRNDKIGIYYQQGSSVDFYHDGVNLCDGSLPAFYQPPKTITVFSTELSGAGIVLSKSTRDKLVREEKDGNVPLEMDVKVPVRIKVGGVKTWTVTVKVSCKIAVNALTEKAQVVKKDCVAHAKPW